MLSAHRLAVSSLFVVLACLSQVGCTGYRTPTIAVVGVDVIEQTEEAVAVDFELDLRNPNADELELRWFNYTLNVNGKQVYSGKRSAEATLPASGGLALGLPAVIPFDRVGWDAGSLPAEAKYTLSGQLLYITPGEIAEILLDTGVRKPKASFSHSGLITLPRAQ